MTTTLTRSKLVTREIKEIMEYTKFGKGRFVAVHVNVTVNGIDSFKADHYAIMKNSTFEKAMSDIAKDKGDFPYRDHIVRANQSYQWYSVTAADLKKFKEFPHDKMYNNYAYEFVCIVQKEREVDGVREAHTKKMYTNVIKKDAKNIIHFKHDDHTFRDACGVLIPVPMHIDYGLRSKEYQMKPAVDYLRTLPNVRMRKEDKGYKSDYPEIVSIPYYNAEFEGETEVSLWVLPTQEQYDAIRGKKKHEIFGLHSAHEHGIFDLTPFKMPKND